MPLVGKGGRPLGLPKTGGRKAGTPNRDASELRSKLEAIGCDPLVELGKIAMDEKNSIDIRVRCNSELATYLYSKRKPTEVSSDHTTDSSDQTTAIYVSTKLDEDEAGNSGETVDRPDSTDDCAEGHADCNSQNQGTPHDGSQS
jgi:hypothetical protein